MSKAKTTNALLALIVTVQEARQALGLSTLQNTDDYLAAAQRCEYKLSSYLIDHAAEIAEREQLERDLVETWGQRRFGAVNEEYRQACEALIMHLIRHAKDS